MSKPSFRERLVFDGTEGAIMDEARRYMLMRPEALMGMFRRLDGPARKQALEALAASVIEMGGNSARAYRAHGGGDPGTLLATVARTAPDLGWGMWEFDRAGTALHLTVRNSPFAAGYKAAPHPVCHAISGMMTAVSRLVFERDDITVTEMACAACGAPACRFEATAG